MTVTRNRGLSCSGCRNAPAKQKGLCDRCYYRQRRYGSPTATRPGLITHCEAEGGTCKARGPYVRGMCGMHYRRWYRSQRAAA